MTSIKVRSRVGADGKLNVMVPIGLAEANREVIVTVEPVEAPLPTSDREEWKRFINQTAGSIQDPSFKRHDQGEYEQREGWE